MQSFEVKDKHLQVTHRGLFGWEWSQSLRGDEESTLNALSFIVAVWRSVREIMESIVYVSKEKNRREGDSDRERETETERCDMAHTHTHNNCFCTP